MASIIGTQNPDFLEGTGGNDTLRGLGGDDVLNGGGGFDQLFGGGENDKLDGGGTDRVADWLYGGLGNDTYTIYTQSRSKEEDVDRIIENQDQGNDTVIFTIDGYPESSFTRYTLGNYVENLVINGPSFGGIGNALNNSISVVYARSNNASYYLQGNGGNDNLFGGEGDDELDGGIGPSRVPSTYYLSGEDRMYGFGGNDTYYVDSAEDRVIEFRNEGYDTVKAYVDYTLEANVERLYLSGILTQGVGNDLDNWIGFDWQEPRNPARTSNLHLEGHGGNDSLQSGSGHDTLIGGYENDILSGGSGDDILIGSSRQGGQHSRDGIDILQGDLDGSGAQGADTFVLGEGGERYYDDGINVSGGINQFALIKDFNQQVDTIQLARLSRTSPTFVNERYIARRVSLGSIISPGQFGNAMGTAIYYFTGLSGPDQPELLAFIEDNQNTPTQFNFNAGYVDYS